MRTIILAVVTNNDASAAIAEAIRQAHWRQARIVAVTAQGDAAGTPVYSPQESRKGLEEALSESGIDHEVTFAKDHTAEQVLELARTHEAELIVVGLRKRSPVMKLFLGSAAQQVILEAPCPVLTVRADVKAAAQAKNTTTAADGTSETA